MNDLVYRMQLGPKTKPKVVHRNRFWHYSGHNPPTWFSDKTGSRIIESNDQTAQSNDQFEQQEQHSNVGDSPSQPAIETETETESIAPELLQKDIPLRQSGCSRQPPDQYGHHF